MELNTKLKITQKIENENVSVSNSLIIIIRKSILEF